VDQRTILFAGPSLRRDRGGLPPGFDLRPPAKCGDLLATLPERPTAVLLVDGVFETGPTVWHKEILLLIEAGIAVYGAASLGALRAAELDVYGMIGIGAIYEAYRDGVIDRDDAVMVSHAPAELGHAPLTLALVDAEASIAASGLDAASRQAAIRIARAMPFRDGTWDIIFTRLAEAIGEDAARTAANSLRKCAFSQKARDTDMLIDAVAREVRRPAAIARVPRTVYLERLLRASVDVETGGDQAVAEQVAPSLMVDRRV
jgi:hypothetical protein